MSVYSKLRGVCLGLMMAVACVGVAYGQEPGRAEQDSASGRMQREGRRGLRRGGRDHGMMGMRRTLRELNLTEAQRQQTRAIMERFVETTKPQREALMQLREQREQGAVDGQAAERAQQLRGEIRAAMKSAHAEVLGILTPEQRTQLEQIQQERKARHKERRKQYDEEQ